MIDPRGQIIGPAVDMWMLGCIAYILNFDKHPFMNKEKEFILSGNVAFPKKGFLTNLTKELLSVHPNARPSATEVVVRIDNELNK